MAHDALDALRAHEGSSKPWLFVFGGDRVALRGVLGRFASRATHLPSDSARAAEILMSDAGAR